MSLLLLLTLQETHLVSWAFSFYSLGHPPHGSVQTSYGADFTHPLTSNEGVSAAPTRRLQPVPSFTRSEAGKEMQKLWTKSQEGQVIRCRPVGIQGKKTVQRTGVTLKTLPWLFLSGTRPFKKFPSLERWSETKFLLPWITACSGSVVKPFCDLPSASQAKAQENTQVLVNG